MKRTGSPDPALERLKRSTTRSGMGQDETRGSAAAERAWNVCKGGGIHKSWDTTAVFNRQVPDLFIRMLGFPEGPDHCGKAWAIKRATCCTPDGCTSKCLNQWNVIFQPT